MSDITAIREGLGLPDVRMINLSIGTTAVFFRTLVGEDPTKRLDFLSGIDFHRPVHIRVLERNTPLVHYEEIRPALAEFKRFAYFTDPGTSPFRVGINPSQYQAKFYNVLMPTTVLVSSASGISWRPRKADSGYKFDRVTRNGGGTQYIIPFGQWPTLVRVGPVVDRTTQKSSTKGWR